MFSALLSLFIIMAGGLGAVNLACMLDFLGCRGDFSRAAGWVWVSLCIGWMIGQWAGDGSGLARFLTRFLWPVDKLLGMLLSGMGWALAMPYLVAFYLADEGSNKPARLTRWGMYGGSALCGLGGLAAEGGAIWWLFFR